MPSVMHMYRLSDFLERLRFAAEPILMYPCNNAQPPSTGCHCQHEPEFRPLTDLPLQIIAIHERDLPQILALHQGTGWGHALLFHRRQVIRHWPSIPTRAELEAVLASLGVE